MLIASFSLSTKTAFPTCEKQESISYMLLPNTNASFVVDNVVLEKTLESPSDSKEIKPVNDSMDVNLSKLQEIVKDRGA